MSGRTYAAVGGGVAAAIAIIVSVVALSGGGPAEPDQPPIEPAMQQDKLKVFASFYPYYEFTKNVAGSQATVEQYMPSGVEAHDWEPRAGDIQILEDADVFVYNGLGMEPYVDQIIDSGDYDHIVFVNTSDGVDLLKPSERHMDDHAEEFSNELVHVIEEYEEGHISESRALESIESILHEHEGDGEDHNGLLESIDMVLHEIEDGDIGGADGIEEIHHLLTEGDAHDGDAHDEEHESEEHEGEGHEGEEHESEERDGHGHGHAHDLEHDPHIWLDPILIKQQVNNIKDALVQADPDNAESYEQNAAAYNEQLDSLDAKIRSELSSCKKDTFVPFHSAFSYFAERYGLTEFALGGLAPDAEASASELAHFVDFIKDNDIGVIFAEELVDPRLAQVIAEEAGAQVMVLSPLEALTPEESASGVTLLEKIEQNLDSLKIALDCQ